jgi:hypothetical protein
MEYEIHISSCPLVITKMNLGPSVEKKEMFLWLQHWHHHSYSTKFIVEHSFFFHSLQSSHQLYLIPWLFKEINVHFHFLFSITTILVKFNWNCGLLDGLSVLGSYGHRFSFSFPCYKASFVMLILSFSPCFQNLPYPEFTIQPWPCFWVMVKRF